MPKPVSMGDLTELAHKYALEGEGLTRICKVEFFTVKEQKSYVGYGDVCDPLANSLAKFNTLVDQRRKDYEKVKGELDRIQQQALPHPPTQKSMCHYIRSGTGMPYLSYEFWDKDSCERLKQAVGKDRESEKQYASAVSRLSENLKEEAEKKMEHSSPFSDSYDTYSKMRASSTQRWGADAKGFEESINYYWDKATQGAQNKNSFRRRMEVANQLVGEINAQLEAVAKKGASEEERERVFGEAKNELKIDPNFSKLPPLIRYKVFLDTALDYLSASDWSEE